MSTGPKHIREKITFYEKKLASIATPLTPSSLVECAECGRKICAICAVNFYGASEYIQKVDHNLVGAKSINLCDSCAWQLAKAKRMNPGVHEVSVTDDDRQMHQSIKSRYHATSQNTGCVVCYNRCSSFTSVYTYNENEKAVSLFCPEHLLPYNIACHYKDSETEILDPNQAKLHYLILSNYNPVNDRAEYKLDAMTRLEDYFSKSGIGLSWIPTRRAKIK